jgi:hypothetical protein
MKYEDKDPGSLTILNQGNKGNLHLCEDDRKNISLIKSHPPTLDQGEDTQEDKRMVDLKVRKEYFQQGRLVLMWTRERVSQICTRSLIVCGMALTILRRRLELVPFTCPHLREGDYHYPLVDPFSSPIMQRNLTS